MKKARSAEQQAEIAHPQPPIRSRAAHEEILKLHKRRDFASLFRVSITVGEVQFEQTFDAFQYVSDREKALYSKRDLGRLTTERIREYSAMCESKRKDKKPYYLQQCDVCNYMQFKTEYVLPESGDPQRSAKSLTFHRAQNIAVNIWIVPGAPVSDDNFMFELFRSEPAPYEIRTHASLPDKEGILTIYNNELAGFLETPIPSDPSHVVFYIDHSNYREWRVTEFAFEMPHALFLALIDLQLAKPPARPNRR